MKILKVNLSFLIKIFILVFFFYFIIFVNSFIDLLKYESQYKKRNILDFTKYIIFSIQPNFEITNQSILVSIEKSIKNNINCCNFPNSEKKIEIINLEIKNNALKKLTSNLPESGRKYQSARLLYSNNKWEEIKFRLRGKSIYHHDSNLPSLRLNLKNNKSINYMNQINLTKPEDPYQISNFYSDFIFNNEDLMVQKHTLVNLIINKTNFGIYHKHHRRDENLIRANKRLPGPLFNLNKINNTKWEVNDFEIKGETKIYDNKKLINELINIVNSIDIENKYVNIDLLWNIANKQKFAKFFALLNLIGSFHTDAKHNLMLYFDPSIGKFEPILDDPLGFGAVSYPRTINRIFNFQNKPDYSMPIYERAMPLYNAMLMDESFVNLKNQYLLSYLDKYNPKIQFEYIDSFYSEVDYFIYNDTKKRAVFETLTGFKSIPITNYGFKKYKYKLKEWIINRHNFLNEELKINEININYFQTNNNVYLNLHYKTNLNIVFKPGKLISKLELRKADNEFIEYENDNIINLIPFLEKTNKNKYAWANEIRYKEYFASKEIKTSFRIKNTKIEKIKAQLDNSFYNSITNKKINVNFIQIDQNKNNYNYAQINNYKNKKINNNIIIENDTIIKEDLIIQPHQTLTVMPGSKIFIHENVSIISYGKIEMLGNNDKNIEIIPYKKNTNWGVIALIGKNTSNSIFNNVDITGGSSKEFNNIILKGMLSIHWSNNVKVINSKIHENQISDDTLNVVHSNVVIKNTLFEKCNMDCVDFDYSNGTIENSIFKNSGNDLLDFMESQVNITNVLLVDSEDKCVSAGEKSNIKIYNSIITNCKVGIASKDESKVLIIKTEFINNDKDMMKYRKNLTYSDIGIINENI